jgi:GntR family transcriptional regulator
MTSDDYVDTRPASRQIAGDLREQILAGDLVERLPSLSALAKDFKASVTTCQNAVEILKREGLVFGQQGKQLVVRKPHVDVMVAGANPVKGDGIRYDLLRVEIVTPPAHIREALSSNDPAVLREMVEVRDGTPVELTRNYYPAAIAAESKLAKFVKLKNANETFTELLGERLVRMTDTLSEREPTRKEAETLRLPPQASVLQTVRVLYVANGRPAQASLLIKAGQRSAVQYGVDLH